MRVLRSRAASAQAARVASSGIKAKKSRLCGALGSAIPQQLEQFGQGRVGGLFADLLAITFEVMAAYDRIIAAMEPGDPDGADWLGFGSARGASAAGDGNAPIRGARHQQAFD